MITLCHPIDNVEHLLLCSALEAADIPYFVVGEYIGGLYPGIQVPWYNERSIRVPDPCMDAGLEVVQYIRSTYSPTGENLTTPSKCRLFLELVLFGWGIPGGTKKFNPKKERRHA